MMPFNWFDVVLALIILGSMAAGLRSGFARVVVGLAATLTGLLLGFWFYRVVGARIAPYVSSSGLADILGFVIIFVGVSILGALLGALLSRLFRWIGLSWFNHFLGGIAGLLRGVLAVAGLAAVLVAFTPSPTPAFLATSRVLPYASEVAAALAEMAPHDLKDSFLGQWENLKQMWNTHRSHSRTREA